MAPDYQKLAKAMTYLRNPECKLILTNTDPTFPTHGDVFPGGYFFAVVMPFFQLTGPTGSGSLSIPIVNASKRKPLVIGKPNKMMMDAILAQ